MAGELRKLDLLNTLALTLINYSQVNGGKGVAIQQNQQDPGWTLIFIRAFFCLECNRLSPDRNDCQWCEQNDEQRLRNSG